MDYWIAAAMVFAAIGLVMELLLPKNQWTWVVYTSTAICFVMVAITGFGL